MILMADNNYEIRVWKPTSG